VEQMDKHHSAWLLSGYISTQCKTQFQASSRMWELCPHVYYWHRGAYSVGLWPCDDR
jgi:Glycosyltransferase